MTVATAAAKGIGVFDSGVGGLTVLKALRQTLPEESFYYLGDTARLPYGSKSPRTIQRYLAQNIGFLAKQGVKMVVVACNSASTVLQERTIEGLPVYGVIQPGAKAALAGGNTRRIAVLGTKATVASGAYVQALRDLDADIAVMQQPCPLLVPLVEEGWDADSVTREVLKRYLAAPLAFEADTMILGCTHYPVLKPMIQKLVGPDIRLIDSAEVMANLVAEDIKAGAISAPSGGPELHVFTTDNGDGFHEVGERILRPYAIDRWELADL